MAHSDRPAAGQRARGDAGEASDTQSAMESASKDERGQDSLRRGRKRDNEETAKETGGIRPGRVGARRGSWTVIGGTVVGSWNEDGPKMKNDIPTLATSNTTGWMPMWLSAKEAHPTRIAFLGSWQQGPPRLAKC
jgi:hypothetical protein